jgi:DNA-binding NarL/FixJ family response regulator
MIQVLVVTAIRLYREGLAAVLSGCPGIAVCGVARDAPTAAAYVRSSPPDVVLVDATLPGAWELVRCVVHPAGARVVAMAVSDQEADLLEWAATGVAGVVGCDGSVEELVAAVRAAARGGLHCSPSMAASLLRHLAAVTVSGGGTRRTLAEDRLTSREHEVVELIAGGLSNKGIARRLGIEVATAKNHVHNILRKLEVEDREEAAAWLRLHGSTVDGEATGVGLR